MTNSILRSFFAPARSRDAALLRIAYSAIYLFMLWDFFPLRDLLFGRAGLYGRLDGLPVSTWQPTALLFYFDSPGLGADEVMRALGLWLLFLDSGKAMSVDAWIRQQRTGTTVEFVAGWPLRCIQSQIALIYFVAGVAKLASPFWRNGTALYYALQIREQNPDFYGFVSQAFLRKLSLPLTYGTLFFELAFPFLVFHARTRLFALVLGVLFHLGIDLSLSIRFFSLTMYCGYVAYLHRPKSAP